GHPLLTEPESKAILAAYGIPTVETSVAATEEEAVRAAEEIGYPGGLKLYSETTTHKTDVDGVRLHLPDAAGARRGHEGGRARGRGAVPGRDGAADGPARRLRADPGQQRGPAVRPGAPLRLGRAAGGSDPGPRAGIAAAHHHPRAPDDGADARLSRLAGGPRP